MSVAPVSPLRAGDVVAVPPATAPLRGEVVVPPSKNYAARWIWTSALCEGETRLSALPASDDAAAMVACCRALGATIDCDDQGARVLGFGARPRPEATLDPANAGAVLRFVMAAAALGGRYHFATAYAESLGRRPQRDLLDALAAWGVAAPGADAEGRLPLDLAGEEPSADRVATSVRGRVSSQYLSALLMVAPARARRAGATQRIAVEGELRSRPAVETTLEVMRARGVVVAERAGAALFEVPPGAYAPGTHAINGDWPSAAALLGAAAVVPGSRIALRGLLADAQGERRVLAALEAAGCEVRHAGELVTLVAPERLRAFRFDGDLATDAVPALAAVAALAEGTSRFEGVANLRHKECDRIAVPLAELARHGIEGRAEADAFEIDGRPEGPPAGAPADFDGHGDHRVLMLGAILALRAPRGLALAGASHVAKSYPAFFDDLARLRTDRGG